MIENVKRLYTEEGKYTEHGLAINALMHESMNNVEAYCKDKNLCPRDVLECAKM